MSYSIIVNHNRFIDNQNTQKKNYTTFTFLKNLSEKNKIKIQYYYNI